MIRMYSTMKHNDSQIIRYFLEYNEKLLRHVYHSEMYFAMQTQNIFWQNNESLSLISLFFTQWKLRILLKQNIAPLSHVCQLVSVSQAWHLKFSR